MTSLSFTGLINNVALLLAMGVVYGSVAGGLRHFKWPGMLFSGLLLGLVGIGLMMSPWQMAPGVIFDARSILLSVSGLFMGIVPVAVALFMTCLYRLYQGGVGALTGIAVIITSGVLGCIWSRLRHQPAHHYSWLEYYLFGITVHLSMLLWMLSLPHPLDITVLKSISLPVMLIFPVGSVLFAKLLAGQMQQLENKKAQQGDNERFKALADTSPLAIYLSTQIEKKAQYINPTFVKLFGYDMAEVPSAEHWWPLAYPDENYRRQIFEEWQRRASQAMANSSEAEPMETVVTCKDGSLKNILWGFKTIGDENWAFGLDLTERRRAEEALKESENMFRALADQSITGIYMFQEPRFLYVNHRFADIFGYSVQEVLDSLRPTDVVAPEEVRDAEERIKKRISGKEKNSHYIARGRHKDDRELWIEVYGTRIDRQGVPTITGTVLDITERKRAEVKAVEQLEELTRWHEALVGREDRVIGIKHEVNELLARLGEPPRYTGATAQEGDGE